MGALGVLAEADVPRVPGVTGLKNENADPGVDYCHSKGSSHCRVESESCVANQPSTLRSTAAPALKYSDVVGRFAGGDAGVEITDHG